LDKVNKVNKTTVFLMPTREETPQKYKNDTRSVGLQAISPGAYFTLVINGDSHVLYDASLDEQHSQADACAGAGLIALTLSGRSLTTSATSVQIEWSIEVTRRGGSPTIHKTVLVPSAAGASAVASALVLATTDIVRISSRLQAATDFSLTGQYAYVTLEGIGTTICLPKSIARAYACQLSDALSVSLTSASSGGVNVPINSSPVTVFEDVDARTDISLFQVTFTSVFTRPRPTGALTALVSLLYRKSQKIKVLRVPVNNLTVLAANTAVLNFGTRHIQRVSVAAESTLASDTYTATNPFLMQTYLHSWGNSFPSRERSRCSRNSNRLQAPTVTVSLYIGIGNYVTLVNSTPVLLYDSACLPEPASYLVNVSAQSSATQSAVVAVTITCSPKRCNSRFSERARVRTRKVTLLPSSNQSGHLHSSGGVVTKVANLRSITVQVLTPLQPSESIGINLAGLVLSQGSAARSPKPLWARAKKVVCSLF
jgi:hypothetical protein